MAKNKKSLARRYVKGLARAYRQAGAGELWDEFFAAAHGVKAKNRKRLKRIYPELPESLAELLSIVDGSYWRKYQGRKFALYFLGSDLEEYPYYLLSAKQMRKDRELARRYYGDYVDRLFDMEDIPIDPRIIHDSKKMRWLHFADCMNNGGTSQLFLDFSPSERGRAGQVVRFLHDPDELAVIADSFDDYLQMLIDGEFNYINKDTVEE